MHRHHCVRLLFTMGVVGSIFGPAVASAQMNLTVTAPNGVTKCLDINNDQSFNGNHLVTWDCTAGGQLSQLWNWLSNGQIRSALFPTKCVDLNNGGSTNGTPVDLFDCVAGASNEVWTLAGAEGFQPAGRFLTSSAQGQCIDLPGGNLNNGTFMDSFACVNGAWNELWSFRNPTNSSRGIGVTVRQTLSGPDITTSGFGFSAGGHVSIEYDFIPFRSGPQPVGSGIIADRNGNFSLFDTEEDRRLTNCFGQTFPSVIVKATDDATGNVQLAHIAASHWCS